MEGLLRYRNCMVERNRLEYGISYDDINWINYRDALELEMERDAHLNDLKDQMIFGYKGSKTDVSLLSHGCKLCAERLWSCLFINGSVIVNVFTARLPKMISVLLLPRH